MTLTTAAALCESACRSAQEAARMLEQAETLDDPDERARLILTGLDRLEQAREYGERVRRECVDSLREQGYTWQRVGQLLGMTRQAAWKRFGKGSHRGRG